MRYEELVDVLRFSEVDHASMNILVVSREVRPGASAIFVEEQVEALRHEGVNVEMLHVREGGVMGYLDAARRVRGRLAKGGVDLVHGHGVSGVASLIGTAASVPHVVTFHGSDIYLPKTRPLMGLVARLSTRAIFVSKKLREQLNAPLPNASVIRCGVDTTIFRPLDQSTAASVLAERGPPPRAVLFSSTFDNPVKGYAHAKAAVEALDGFHLVELAGYSRDQVAALMNVVGALVITSDYEGGPLVAKEAVACGLPVISVDVGDVREVLDGVSHSYVVDRNPNRIAELIEKVAGARTNGPLKADHFSNRAVAREIVELYKEVIDR